MRFGAESHRDYVDIGPEQFYERLYTTEELPTTSQPTPADFLSAYEELSAFDRVLSLQLSSKISGTFESAGRAAAESEHGVVRAHQYREDAATKPIGRTALDEEGIADERDPVPCS